MGSGDYGSPLLWVCQAISAIFGQHGGGFHRAGIFVYVESEKQNLLWTLEAQRNDKRSYATNQMLYTMCKEDSYGIPRLGTIEDVQAITPQSLYAHYRKLISESPDILPRRSATVRINNKILFLITLSFLYLIVRVVAIGLPVA